MRAIWFTRFTFASATFMVNRYFSLGGYLVVVYYQCFPNMTYLQVFGPDPYQVANLDLNLLLI